MGGASLLVRGENERVCGSEYLASSALHNRFHDRLVRFRAEDFVEELCFDAVAMKCFVAVFIPGKCN